VQVAGVEEFNKSGKREIVLITMIQKAQLWMDWENCKVNSFRPTMRFVRDGAWKATFPFSRLGPMWDRYRIGQHKAAGENLQFCENRE
jgi:hypothetical protein